MSNKETSQFCIGDIVFVKRPGYMAWPACLLEYREQSKKWFVKFLLTDEKAVIHTNKLCLFETHKERFVTEENLSYTEFQDSVEIARKLLQEKGLSTTSPPSQPLPFKQPSPPKQPIAEPSTTRQNSHSAIVAKQSAYEVNFVLGLQKQRPMLKFEPRFVALINELRKNLICTSTNVQAALAALDQLAEQSVCQYMLLRNFECFNTIRKLRNYVGNIWHTKPNSKELMKLASEAALVRKKATDLYDFFTTFFPIHYKHNNFWLEFCTQHSIYLKYTVPLATSPTDENADEGDQDVNKGTVDSAVLE